MDSAAHVLLCLARWESGRPYPCVLPKGHDGQHQHPMDPRSCRPFPGGFRMKPAIDAQPVEQLELVPSPPRLSVCRTCRQSIIWTRTERGKKMPLDADPVADHDQAGLFVLRETERRDGPLAIAAWGLNGTEPHYRCHFDTCSDRGRSGSSQVSQLAGSTWEDAFGVQNG